MVGVAEDLALGLIWNKNAVERDKTIVYDRSMAIECYGKERADSREQPILIYTFWRVNLALGRNTSSLLHSR